MRVIHTADWHLGQRLAGRDRSEEHRRFLSWLIGAMEEHDAHLLVLAGDVFDSFHPGHSTVQLYYDFLRDLADQKRHAVIVGGNHDSPAQLNAPRQLLRRLNVHVIGCPSANQADDIVLIPPPPGEGNRPAVVCAVPFLRERDLAPVVVGEDAPAREERLREALRAYFAEVRWLAQPFRERGWPILATGHLAVQGAAKAEEDHELFLGHLGAISESLLPGDFDYLALGHMHQGHAVGGREHMRYSGSPVAVSFAEAGQAKEVILLEFQNGRLTSWRALPIPEFRALRRFGGTLATLEAWLREQSKSPLTPWLEVTLSSEEPASSDLPNKIVELAAAHGWEALKVLAPSLDTRGGDELEIVETQLQDLRPEEVFLERLRASEVDPEGAPGQDLLATFAELLALHEARRMDTPERA